MNKAIPLTVIAYSLILFSSSCFAQSDTLRFFDSSPQPNQKRLDVIKYFTIGLYPVSMYWLYTEWYESYPQRSFHFFNDADEWEQMDKAGHVFTSYSISNGYAGVLQWGGLDRKKAACYGTGVSLLYQTTIEVFDGFSSQWGFSLADVSTNLLGSGFFLGQELFWNEQRIKLKYSFHQTDYAKYRPDQLGDGLSENWLKDYNGQTYWMSFNPSMFMQSDTHFPKWLSVAAGYGAEGMIGGKSNPELVKGEAVPSFNRYRQYYLAFDVALDRIKTKSRFLHGMAQVFAIVKIPAPTIEFNEAHRPTFYWLYF